MTKSLSEGMEDIYLIALMLELYRLSSDNLSAEDRRRRAEIVKGLNKCGLSVATLGVDELDSAVPCGE